MASTNGKNEFDYENEGSFQQLERAISLSQGRFSLTFAVCNYEFQREDVISHLKEITSSDIYEFLVPENTKTLYTTLQTEFSSVKNIEVAMVSGLETVVSIEDLLISANQVRDEFRKNFPFPLIIWINDEILKKLVRLAPDFNSWAGIPIRFRATTKQLLYIVNTKSSEVFSIILDDQNKKLLSAEYVLESQKNYRELNMMRAALQERKQDIPEEVEAGLDFIAGLRAYKHNDVKEAFDCYRNSYLYWQKTKNLDKQAVSLTYISLCHIRCAALGRGDSAHHFAKAKSLLLKCIQFFWSTKRVDLIEQLACKLCEVLSKLNDWKSLKKVSISILQLCRTYSELHDTPKFYAYLAKAELELGNNSKAKENIEIALKKLGGSPQRELETSKSSYLFLLARIHKENNSIEDAINTLTTAEKDQKLSVFPKLHIEILEELSSLYFLQGQKSDGAGEELYREAFRIKQKQRSLSQQYGFQAFTGAGFLQPMKIANNRNNLRTLQERVAEEISASGRQQDIQILMSKIARNDCSLIIIHGQSGVGKSSLIEAGLLPTLKSTSINNRKILPVSMRVYSSGWLTELAKLLQISYLTIDDNFNSPLTTAEDLIEQFRKYEIEENITTLLIFDQFEEFFFEHRNRHDRHSFFNFLHKCLQTPFVKVILSLREDYLHHLLECERLKGKSCQDALDDLLNRGNRFYVGNLSTTNAEAVFKRLTDRAEFYLQEELLHEIIADLSNDFDEVRPIELQVVGSQLQAEYIKTPQMYKRWGAKEKLVERFLDGAIENCGNQNQQIARLVLFLLTEEGVIRPYKTHYELLTKIKLFGFSVTPEQLNLVLEILVGSGIVLLIPESTNRFQLVHDYLVTLIKNQPSIQSELIVARHQAATVEEQLRRDLDDAKEHNENIEKKLAEALAQIERLQTKVLEHESSQVAASSSEDISSTDKHSDTETSEDLQDEERSQKPLTLIEASVAGLAKFISQVISRSLQTSVDINTTLINASNSYVKNYEARHCRLKVLGMREPVALDSIYTNIELFTEKNRLHISSLKSLENFYRQSESENNFQLAMRSKTNEADIVKNKQYLLVLGGPGSGKSTFLRKIGLDSLQGRLTRGRNSQIPVFIELKMFSNGKINVEKQVEEEFRYCSFPSPDEFTKTALRTGKLLLLLDGLDSLPKKQRALVSTELQDFVDRYPQNQFVISCRSAAYKGGFRRFSDVTIADFNDEQIKSFIEKWFSSTRDQENNIPAQCWNLLSSSEYQPAKELAKTPLLLTFLCLVYDRSQTLPTNRSAIYRKALSILLEEWSAEKRIVQDPIYEGLHTDLEQVLLSEIAYKGFIQDKFLYSGKEIVSQITNFLQDTLNVPSSLDSRSILNAIEIQQGILVERAEDIYSFSHLTLQEYLTAQYIADNSSSNIVSQYLSDNRWQEVFVLVAGSLRKADTFLHEIEKHAQTYISNSSTIQRVFAWSEAVTSRSLGNYSAAAKRAEAVALFLDLAEVGTVYDTSRAEARTKACELAQALASELSLDYSFNIKDKISSRQKSGYLRTLERDLELARTLEELKIFSSVNFKEIVANLEKMKESTPHELDSFEQWGELFQEIQLIWISSLKLDSDLITLSEESLTCLAQYLEAINLLVRCKKAAIRVSQESWLSIEERILRSTY